MQDFKDKTNDRWIIDLTIGTVMRVKRESGGRFDLFDAAKDNLAQRLNDDLSEFWELLLFLVNPESREPKMTADQFGERMAGDCLLDAQQKFFAEWRDFFRSLQRLDQATVLEKLAKYQAKAMELVLAKLASPELTAIDAKVEAKMSETLNSTFGSVLASLESTLDRSPSGSSGA